MGKNNKLVIVLLVIIIAILSVLCVLFATGTISFNNNNNEENNNLNVNITDNNGNQNEINNSDKVNFDELSNFGKSDYNFVKNEHTDKYSFNLSVDGKINISFENYISNISNAKDIHLFSTMQSKILYILTEDGYIYKYDTINYTSKIYEATKISNYNNIKKMLTYRTRRANAGGCDYFVIIDENGKYYNLDSMCV